MKEYAFDLMISAVVRVTDKSAEAASFRICKIIETTTPDELERTLGEHGVQVTEMSTASRPRLFEADGKPAEDQRNEGSDDRGRFDPPPDWKPKNW